MLIKRLKLKNFMIFNDVDIDFKNINVVSIIGQWESDIRRSNGSGKSALLESIPYALFGSTRSKLKQDVIKRGHEKCEVVLVFELNGKEFKVSRSRNKNTTQCFVEIDGVRQTSQSKDLDDFIQSSLGVDSKLFDLIYFFRQNDQFGFLDSTPGERKAYLGKIFDMSVWDKCQEYAKNKYDKIERLINKIKDEISGVNSILSGYKTIEQLEDDLCEIYSCFQVYYDLIDENKGLVIEYEEYLEELKKFQIEIEEIIKKKRSRFIELKSEYESNIKIIFDLKSDLNKNDIYLNRQRSQLGQLSDKISSIIKNINGLTEKQVIEELGKQDVHLKKLKSDLISFSAERNRIVKFLEKIEKNQGNNCPECGQEVTEFYVFGVKSRYDVELKSIKNKIKIVEDALKQVEAEIKRLNSCVENIHLLSTYQNQYECLESEVKNANSKSIEIGKKIVSVEDKNKVVSLELAKYHDPGSSKTVYSFFIENIKLLITKVSKCIKSVQNYIIELDQILKKYQFNIDKINDDINKRVSIENQIKLRENELNNLSESFQVYKELISIFGKTGVQSIIIENVIGLIEQFANSILLKMQTNFVVKFKTVKQIQSGNDRETLDIFVYVNGVERSIETYSGGERTLINFAIRLALSKILSSIYNVEVKSIFLDETLAALDEVNESFAVGILKFLSNSFNQIFVISHNDKVRDHISGNIIVTRYQDHSEVFIK